MSAAIPLPVKRWCQPCKDRGRLAIADRDVEGTPMCKECFRGAPSRGVPIPIGLAVLLRKEKTMAKRIDDATRAAIRKDAADGLTIEEIRKKRGVGWGTARAIVADSGSVIPRAKRKLKHSIVSSNGAGTLKATPEICDALWSALPIERKIAALNFIFPAH